MLWWIIGSCGVAVVAGCVAYLAIGWYVAYRDDDR
jgi:hypothetical protein